MYLVVITILFVLARYMLLVGACVFVLSIGFHLYAIALAKCIKKNLLTISRTGKTATNREVLLKQIIDFIEFDSSVKQLSKFFN